MEGIRYYLTPDFSKLLHVNIWLKAYGQIFFSLSLASGVMIGYGSYSCLYLLGLCWDLAVWFFMGGWLGA